MEGGLNLCADCGSGPEFIGLAVAAALACVLCWAGRACYRRSRMPVGDARVCRVAAVGLYGLAAFMMYSTVIAWP